LSVHSKKLLNTVKTGRFSDPDTPSLPGIFDYAALSVSSALMAMFESVDNKNIGFSLMRPPGHHATRNTLGGFCYFNNIAIAVKRFIDTHPTSKTAIIDIDCHHGNGTQNIFVNNKQVLFTSLHQIPLYPGSGLSTENNCINYPLSPGTEEPRYLKTLSLALDEVKKFSPDLIAVSAGFDTYRHDPLTQLSLKKETYTKIGQLIASLDLPRFAVLEGGYSSDLPECIYNFLTGFAG
jgi:acetoin utilization deacetylase AcuC-like enzyme